jgi:hypothetical protein
MGYFEVLEFRFIEFLDTLAEKADVLQLFVIDLLLVDLIHIYLVLQN